MKVLFLPALLLAALPAWFGAGVPSSGNVPAATHRAAPSATAAVRFAEVDERPRVAGVNPDSAATGVDPCSSVTAYVAVPTNGGVDNNTLNSTNVKLYQISGTATPIEIKARVNGTGGGDAIILAPQSSLLPNTTYRFIVTEGVRSLAGYPFYRKETVFTTGNYRVGATLPVAFEKLPIAATRGEQYASLAVGPDRKLYALQLNGSLKRFPINGDGTLGTGQTINTLRLKYGGRLAVGLALDPASTAAAPIVWITHCSDKQLAEAPLFEGKLSKLTGANLETETLVVDKLPRSRKDHLVNSIAFRPGQPNILYFSQASNSAMGAHDPTWGRDEALLSGTILKLDLAKLPATLPLNVETTSNQAFINAASATSMRMPDGKYNPYASTSPLTIYASGIRNAYDLVWHSNGYLYTATNGSNYGGNTPASVPGTRRPDGTFYSGPAVPATTNVVTQPDLLYRINPNVTFGGRDYHGYFGHTNPRRGEYVLNRGYADNKKYASTTGADANFGGIAFNFDVNKSPNGTLEYKSTTFNGALKGKLLVCRFSNNDDVIVLTPGADGNIDPARVYADCANGIPGLSGFNDPLDVAEDPVTGNLYVSEYSETAPEKAQLTLCRVPPGKLLVDNLDKFPAPDQMTFSKVQHRSSVTGTPTNENHDAVTLRLHNKGIGMLRLQGLAVTNSAFFKVEQVNGVAYTAGALPLVIASGGYADVRVRFVAADPPLNNGRVKVLTETLTITTNDPSQPTAKVTLRGLWQKYIDGNNEPYVAEILGALGFGTKTGYAQANTRHDAPLAASDEIFSSYFVRADGARPVTVRQVAAYHRCCQTQDLVRWEAKAGFTGGGDLLRHTAADGQTLLPRKNDVSKSAGSSSFNPGVPFALRIGGEFTDPQRNVHPGTVTVSGTTYRMRGVRVWKARDAAGNLIPHAYLFAHESLGSTANFDYNENVYFASNLKPETGTDYASELAVTQSGQNFGTQLINSTTPFALNLRSLGLAGEPDVVISSVQVVGQHAAEFTAAMPADATLSPGEATTLAVGFSPKTVGLKNAALLIYADNAPTPYRVPLLGMAGDGCNNIETVLRLKGAADADVTIGTKLWKADQPYRVGNLIRDNVSDASSPIGGTTDDALYRSYLSTGGDLQVAGYAIPKLAPGKYLVRMHFAENYFGTLRNGHAGGPGSRVFSVAMEGTTRLANLDIAAEAGSRFALVKDFAIDLEDGVLNVQFSPTANRLALSGFELFRISSSSSIAFSISKTDISCQPGASNGTASVTGLTGGTAPYTYRWNTIPVQTGATASGLRPGTYTVTVSDARGCSRTLSANVTKAPQCQGYRVNAGGGSFTTIDSRVFAPDAFFSGGTPATALTGQVTGTADDYLYHTGRFGTAFSYNFPVGNGSYDVVLHFAETYFGNIAPGGVGSRKFNVTIEGQRKLTDYDIFAHAGGAMRIAAHTFRATVTDGTLNIAFSKGSADNPRVAAIEVLPSGSVFRINAGGNEYTTIEGKTFSPDVYFAHGEVATPASADVLNTQDDYLYQTGRHGGGFSYGIPIGNGIFDVVLHFNETYWGNIMPGGVGSRKFNVFIELEKRLGEYDIFQAAGGAMRPVKETVRVVVTDGVLNFYFARGTADIPRVSAIEIIPIQVYTVDRVAAEGGNPDVAGGIRLYPNPVQDKFHVTLPEAPGAVATAILDATGKVHAMDAHRWVGDTELEVDAATLRPGLYLLRLQTDQGTHVLKFVKQ